MVHETIDCLYTVIPRVQCTILCAFRRVCCLVAATKPLALAVHKMHAFAGGASQLLLLCLKVNDA